MDENKKLEAIVSETLRMTKTAYAKMNMIAKLVSTVVGYDIEVGGVLLSSTGDVVDDVLPVIEQEVTSTSGDLSRLMETYYVAEKKLGKRVVGIFHSHGICGLHPSRSYPRGDDACTEEAYYYLYDRSSESEYPVRLWSVIINMYSYNNKESWKNPEKGKHYYAEQLVQKRPESREYVRKKNLRIEVVDDGAKNLEYRGLLAILGNAVIVDGKPLREYPNFPKDIECEDLKKLSEERDSKRISNVRNRIKELMEQKATAKKEPRHEKYVQEKEQETIEEPQSEESQKEGEEGITQSSIETKLEEEQKPTGTKPEEDSSIRAWYKKELESVKDHFKTYATTSLLIGYLLGVITGMAAKYEGTKQRQSSYSTEQMNAGQTYSDTLSKIFQDFYKLESKVKNLDQRVLELEKEREESKDSIKNRSEKRSSEGGKEEKVSLLKRIYHSTLGKLLAKRSVPSDSKRGFSSRRVNRLNACDYLNTELVSAPSSRNYSNHIRAWYRDKAESDEEVMATLGQVLAGDYWENGRKLWKWSDRIKKLEELYNNNKEALSSEDLKELGAVLHKNSYVKRKHPLYFEKLKGLLNAEDYRSYYSGMIANASSTHPCFEEIRSSLNAMIHGRENRLDRIREKLAGIPLEELSERDKYFLYKTAYVSKALGYI